MTLQRAELWAALRRAAKGFSSECKRAEMEVARHEMPGISLAKKQMHQEKNKKDSA